ncbi:unnamed protein product [Closterium sp. Naga37s-1]|nr:unnamed protein product [Closterium sp. Naga37s-1]
MKQCSDAVNGVTEERKMLEGARTKLDEMSRNIIEGVAAANAKASEDAVEKQLKLVEERLVASVAQGIKKAVKEDLFYSAIPPESMKVLKDVRRVHERSVPPSSVGGHVGSPVASPPSRARHHVGKSVEDNEVIVLEQSPPQKTTEAAPKPPTDAFAPLRDMLSGLGKKGGKGLVAGEQSGAPIESVASAGKGAMGNRGAPTPSGSAAGKGAGETRGAPSQVVIAGGLLSKTTADTALQLGVVGHPVEPVGKRAFSSTPPVAPVIAPALGDVHLSKPASPPHAPRGSPSASRKRQASRKLPKRGAGATESGDVVELVSLPGQAPVEAASTVVAGRHEKAKKARVLRYAAPGPPDDEGKVAVSPLPAGKALSLTDRSP